MSASARLSGQAYQYLQTSRIPTNKFQRSLPRLKIPKLDKTCQRYVAALEPIFSQQDNYTRALEVAKEFQAGPGRDLHENLLRYDKSVKHTSYINEFWFDMYLASRSPLPLNFNPFMVWRDAPTSGQNHQLVRSTNFLVSAARFKRSLEENVLEPEVFHMNPKKVSSAYPKVMALVPDAIATYVSFAFKAFPLDMSQYKNLFNSTRVPREGKDEIVKSDPGQNRHVLVMRHGQFYTFDLLDEAGALKSPETIYANLAHIAAQPAPKDAANFLSISELTTANRDVWAREREHLLSVSEQNKRNLAALDSAMFVLCLDDVEYGGENSQANLQDDRIAAAHNFLHGCNATTSGGGGAPTNRWFDKSFSLIVTRDGHAAINFEHSWGDGVAILRFFNDTFNDSTARPQLEAPSAEPVDASRVQVERLDFELDARLRESIAKCRAEHARATGQLELGAVEYAKLNRDYFKRNKLSPDAMSQLSFQLAYKKLYQHTPVSYESCSTAAFRGGRTETVRPSTNETNRAAEAIIGQRGAASQKKSLSNNELKALLQTCSQRHYQLCKEASMGDGFDRHLFALKELALRSGKQLPDLYKDPVFVQSQHYVLSTSTLYGECFAGGGFAPVVPDGFGLGYGYVDANFGVLVSSYKPHRSNAQFVQALNESLDDLRKIVEQ